ncbi:MAG: glycosyltransferase N-terminal domain-containing protein, partial [Pseudomonadota bacterium]
MGLALYTALARLVLPFVLVALWWRGRRHPALRVPLGERLGRTAPALPWRADQRPLWIHAVSVGEVQAAAGLIAALRLHHPRLPLLLTMATATGRARAESLYRDALLPDASGHTALALAYAPFDLPGAAAAFLERARPVAAVFLETELWPNLLAACSARRLPVSLVSARVSERSVRRYLRFAPRLLRSMLGDLALIAAQTTADRSRFVALGAAPERVLVTGNLKFDLSLPADLAVRAQTQRDRYLGTRRAWVAGST